MTMRRFALAATFTVALAGCATVPPADRAANDPLEPLNRAVFDFNDRLDTTVIKPVAQTYLDVVPAFVRDRVRAFIDNLAEPRIFVNDMLQGRFDAAGITLSRFLANTIAGVGGLFDVATGQGLRRQTGDFGQTLYAWGVEDGGPYVVLLFFGSSDVRDASRWCTVFAERQQLPRIWNSQGSNRWRSSYRGSARYSRTNASCTMSSASSGFRSMARAKRRQRA